jgi:hypothetical protein
MENNMKILRILDLELPYDPATYWIGIWRKENQYVKDICSSTLTEAIFTIAMLFLSWLHVLAGKHANKGILLIQCYQYTVSHTG